MKRVLAMLVVVLVLLATVVPDASANGRGYRHHHGGWWWPGAIVGGLAFGIVAAATYPIWAAPRTYVTPVYVPAATYSPPVVYQPAHVYHAPPALVQREVVYPHGRYVLYGDGVTQAWQWVWIAAAPAPPAPPAPPTQ